MTEIGAFTRDDNHIPITTFGLTAKKSVTFAGGTGDAIGDKDGTQNPYTLFTVTGVVAARVFGVCGSTLVGAGTLEVGISGSTAVVLAQIADATALATDELYLDATPTTKVEALPNPLVFSNGQDIIMTVGSADITSGQIDFYCLWTPISTDGKIIAA